MQKPLLSILMPLLLELLYGTAFSLCSLATFGGLFYRKVKHPVLFPLLFGIVNVLLCLVQQLLLGALLPSVMVVFHTIAAFLLLTGRKWDHLLSLVMAEIFSMSLISSVQMAVFAITKGGERGFLAVTLLYALIYAVSVGFVYFLQWLVRSDDREPLGKLQMLLLTGVTGAVTVYNLRNYGSSLYVPDVSLEAALPAVLILMSASVLLLLSVKTEQAERFRALNAMSETYMTAQARHFEQAREADTEMRMLRHDMKNHITVMNGLYAAGKTEELGAYLKTLGSSFAEMQAVNSIGSEIADAILAEKRALAESKGIRLLTDGSLQGLDISAVTLCTVLSNLLDNAIEATGEGQEITLSARRSGSFYYLCITNPTSEPVPVSGDIPTAKPDSAHHGLGLKSVRKAVEKCGGTLELSCKEAASGDQFTAEVLLPARN
ncbi:MAG: GHKL domain-containing protein [Oscillospiraceae bacterium]|nr:GHKL domain-containing protein [Oscillospiraceae bacterium]